MTLQTQGLQTLEQLRTFLEGSQPLGFEVASRKDAYDFINQTLRHFRYARLGKADKGLVRRYLCKVTGCSRAQMIRPCPGSWKLLRMVCRCWPARSLPISMGDSVAIRTSIRETPGNS